MNSTILVSGLAVGLGILLIANLAATRAVSRPILELALRWLWHQMGWSVAMGKSAN